MAPRWLPGTWVGKRWNSDEHLVAMEDGAIVRTRGVRIRPVQDTWSVKKVGEICGKPWDPIGTMTYDKITDERPYKCSDVKTAKPEEKDSTPVPRGFRITKKMIERAGGPTPGCPKCRAISQGVESLRTQSEACRKRMVEVLLGDTEFQEAKARADERANKYCEEKLKEDEVKVDQNHAPSASDGRVGSSTDGDRGQEERVDEESAEVEIPIPIRHERDREGDPEHIQEGRKAQG